MCYDNQRELLNTCMAEGEREPLQEAGINEDTAQVESSGQDLRRQMFANKEMYHLSGTAELTKEDLDRYLESNAELNSEIPAIIEKALKSDLWSERLRGVELIPYAALDVSKIIEQGFHDEDSRVSLAASKYISLADTEVRERLERGVYWMVEERLKDRDHVVREDGVKLIPSVLEEERSRFIEVALRDMDFDVRSAGVDAIPSALPHERARLIEQALQDPVQVLRLRAVDFISQTPETDRVRLLEQVLIQGKWVLREAAAKFIKDQPAEVQDRLGLRLLPLVKEGLDSGNSAVEEFAVNFIPYLPSNERTGFIREALQHANARVRSIAVQSIPDMPKNEREELLKLQDALIEKGIVFPVSQEKVSKENHLEAVIQQDPAESAYLKALAIKTPLYKRERGRFFHRPFVKSGSETTLLDIVPGQEGASLRDRVIVRHIPLEAYLQWRRIYEAVDVWKKHGFGYVPIEPIVKVARNKDGGVDVFARVIQGPALATWLNRAANLYTTQIQDEAGRIEDVLDELGVVHGHTHGGNFLVYFDRDQQGEVDLGRVPNVYLIDFDQAASQPQ